MQLVIADIWDLHKEGIPICIPTNYGWKEKEPCVAIMGRGLAKQASDRFPELAEVYGKFCRDNREDQPHVCWWPQGNLYLVVTKPLKGAPNSSWKNKSDLATIRRATTELRLTTMTNGHQKVGVPLLGCGEGGLVEDDVLPVLYTTLWGSQFKLVVSTDYLTGVDTEYSETERFETSSPPAPKPATPAPTSRPAATTPIKGGPDPSKFFGRYPGGVKGLVGE